MTKNVGGQQWGSNQKCNGVGIMFMAIKKSQEPQNLIRGRFNMVWTCSILFRVAFENDYGRCKSMRMFVPVHRQRLRMWEHASISSMRRRKRFAGAVKRMVSLMTTSEDDSKGVAALCGNAQIGNIMAQKGSGSAWFFQVLSKGWFPKFEAFGSTNLLDGSGGEWLLLSFFPRHPEVVSPCRKKHRFS